MIFLGVDGGGTKTALALISGTGELLASAQSQGSYRAGEPGVGPRHLADVLGHTVPALCEIAGVTTEQLDYAFFGVPAYGELSADQPLIDAVPRAVLGHDRYRCDNDVVCGWAGALGSADGISVVAGTGSIGYGRWDGRATRAGGWGELFGDEGSGYSIGIRALQTFSQMADGRLPTGPLHQRISRQLKLDADLDVLDVVLHRWTADRSRIAALSRVVGEVAARGDPLAAAIISDATTELARLVTAIASRLEIPSGRQISVSYSGGVFNAPSVARGFAERLAESSADYRVSPPLYPPAIGAALLAAQLAGRPLDEQSLARLRSVRLSGTDIG